MSERYWWIGAALCRAFVLVCAAVLYPRSAGASPRIHGDIVIGTGGWDRW